MSSFFDYVKSINNKKLIDFNEKEYDAFMVNRNLSYFPDTVHYANEMNRFSNIPLQAQYHFYFNAISQRRRFSKWAKVENDKNILMVSHYYKCNINRAKEYLDLLSKEDIEFIRKKLDKGGK